jgi:GTP cyclohydrolase I
MKTEDAVVEMLKNIGEDIEREGLVETPKRIAQMHEEIFAGYKENPESVLKIFDAEGARDMVLVKDIEYYSTCEHHMVPFMGYAHIAYLPDGKITGLSKLPRLVEIFAKRLQNQERLTLQVAEALMKGIAPRGVAVMFTGKHLCMHSRGVKNPTSETITTSWLGEFETNAALRQEFLMQVK